MKKFLFLLWRRWWWWLFLSLTRSRSLSQLDIISWHFPEELFKESRNCRKEDRRGAEMTAAAGHITKRTLCFLIYAWENPSFDFIPYENYYSFEMNFNLAWLSLGCIRGLLGCNKSASMLLLPHNLWHYFLGNFSLAKEGPLHFLCTYCTFFWWLTLKSRKWMND